MAAANALQKKGFFSIITALFLVIIIVSALIGFVAIYSSMFKLRLGSLDKSEKMMDAKLFKGSFLACHGAPYLLEEALIDERCSLAPGISGYSVVQEASFGCQPKAFAKGNINSASSLRFPYIVAVQQENSADMCLARLTIYV